MNSLGLHDTLRYGPRSMANEFKSHSAIKDRLENVSDLSCQNSQVDTIKWEETQDSMKLTLMRNLYGVSLPLQIMMERKIVAKVCRPIFWLSLANHSIHRTPTCLLCRKVTYTWTFLCAEMNPLTFLTSLEVRGLHHLPVLPNVHDRFTRHGAQTTHGHSQ
jgi:hypothetical protein